MKLCSKENHDAFITLFVDKKVQGTVFSQGRQEDGGGGKRGKMSVCKETLFIRAPAQEKSNYLSVCLLS
jgi:hypothetical protein